MKFTPYSRRNCNMKKTLIIAASILAIAGCKKAELTPEQGQENLITRKVSLAADDATVKSFFDTKDNFVKLTGAEELAVAYSNANESTYESIIKGTSDGSSNYSFSHSAIDKATGYNYYFILPYRDSKNISTNGSKNGTYVKLDSIQHPTATSFDPLQDYIMGKPIYNAETQATEMTAENLKLKRLFALVRVTLSDGENALGGEPLNKVSISFPAATDNKVNGLNHKKNNLINLCYLQFDENFSNAGCSGYGDWGTNHASTSVTAEYAEGLAAGEDGKYTVWYVTLPVEKAKDTELTVTAQSKTLKVSRKISIPSDMKLVAGAINDIPINISGADYAVEELADPNDYWSLYNAGQDITVGGQVINKAKNPGGVLLEGDTATKDNLQKGGLIFLGSNVNLSDHLKLGGTDYENPKETILIGRRKDVQPKISLTGSKSIYFENGKTIIKNIDITSGTANQLFVTTASIAADIDYAVIEDCNITASKHVYVFNVADPVNVVKSISFDNCVINMAGTDNSYTVCRMGASNAEKTITASGYAKFESVSINNCIIYANTVHTDGKLRRMLVDYGSNSNSVNDKGVRTNYQFPTENLNITVTNNTIVNLNASSNIFVRAYVANSATINKNVIYTDLTPVTGKYSATYMFGLYKTLEGNHVYKVRENYSYDKCSNTGDKADAITWKYTSAGPHGTYSVGKNTAVHNNTAKLPITIGSTTPGYYPVNTAVVTNGAGASYDTKYWITAGE